MLRQFVKRPQFQLASKKYMRENQEPSHSPTTHLWPTGEGRIPTKEVLVSGWNVNGFRSVVRKQQLQPFWKGLKPDFLCLNETKVDFKGYQKEIQKQNTFEGYYQYWNFCKISAGYSGVMVLTPHKPISIVEDLPGSTLHSLEGRMLTLQYESFFLVNVYKPNSGSKLERLDYRTQEYDECFNSYMRQLVFNKDVIIVGDLNVSHQEIDLANPTTNRRNAGFTYEERVSFQKLLNIGFNDSFRCMHPSKRQYTWWSYSFQARQKNVGWRIDYILTSRNLKVLAADIHDSVTGSDHCPVSARIQIN